jgi:phage terminase large subunit-like protein
VANFVKLPGLIKKLKRSGYPDIPLTKSDELALLDGCYFDAKKGWKPVDYIEFYCKVSKGSHAGKELTLLPWQTEQYLVPVFGWQTKEGLRRITKSITFISKKNGKSTICSALSAYLADEQGDGEKGSEVYLCATTRDQAGIVFKETASMIEGSPTLLKRFKVIRSSKTITSKDNTSWIQSLASEANSAEGKNAHALILDEIHAWHDADFYGSIRYATAGREQPLILIISTAGSELYSIGGGEYEYAKGILSGNIEDQNVWPLIFEADPSDDLSDPKVWMKANPSLGHTIPVAGFEKDYNEAKTKGGKDWSDFKRYRLNIWGGADAPYLNSQLWSKGARTYKEEDLHGQLCYAGLDISSKEDITSLALCFPQEDGYKFIWRHWVPGDKITERLARSDKSYFNWMTRGDLINVPGARIEQELVMQQIKEEFKNFNIQGFAVESWNAQGILDELIKLIEEPVEVTPSYRHYSEPTKEFKALIEAGMIHHRGEPIMQWMIENLHVKENNFLDIMPVKKDKKKKYKIDGCISAILGLKLALIAKREADFVSIYDGEGSILL